MKTTEIVLLLVVALLVVCLIFREPTTIILVLCPEIQRDQPKTVAAIHPEPVPKFHGFAMA
jgi:hypothetical protein